MSSLYFVDDFLLQLGLLQIDQVKEISNSIMFNCIIYQEFFLDCVIIILELLSYSDIVLCYYCLCVCKGKAELKTATMFIGFVSSFLKGSL